MSTKVINMGTVKGQEWIGKKVTLFRKIPERSHEVEITSAHGWEGIEVKEVGTGREFVISEYGEQGELAFTEVELLESN